MLYYLVRYLFKIYIVLIKLLPMLTICFILEISVYFIWQKKHKKQKSVLMVLKWEICSVFQTSPEHFQMIIYVKATRCSICKISNIKRSESMGTMGHVLPSVHLEPISVPAGCFPESFPPSLITLSRAHSRRLSQQHVLLRQTSGWHARRQERD